MRNGNDVKRSGNAAWPVGEYARDGAGRGYWLLAGVGRREPGDGDCVGNRTERMDGTDWAGGVDEGCGGRRTEWLGRVGRTGGINRGCRGIEPWLKERREAMGAFGRFASSRRDGMGFRAGSEEPAGMPAVLRRGGMGFGRLTRGRKALCVAINVVFWALFLVCLVMGFQAASEEPAGMPAVLDGNSVLMGTNLYGVNDYSPEIPFANVLKQARVWVSAGKYGGADGRPLALDGQGYPVSLLSDQTAVSYLFTTVTHHPEGEYAFEYDGGGTVTFSGAGKRLSNGNVQVSAGTVVIRITKTPVSNMRLWLPGHGAGDVFNKQFLKSVTPYYVLRFMNWTHTNSTWGQTETLPGWGEEDDFTWADNQGGGVPISVCLSLCDTIGARPWFCIHHKADDAYISRFFKEIEAWRPAIIEYANEVWNGQYRQSGYCGDAGVALGLDPKPWPAKLLYQADRTRRIKELSGGKGTVVVGSQAANAWVGATLLERCNGIPLPEGALVDVDEALNGADGLAIAPYFTCENPTVERLRTVAIPQALGWVVSNAAVARRYNAELVVYECGQHLIGQTSIQNTADMEALYRVYFGGIVERAPGVTACHFTNVSPYGTYGDWGTTDNLYGLDTAKRRAVLAFCLPKEPSYWLKEAGISLRRWDLQGAGMELMWAGAFSGGLLETEE